MQKFAKSATTKMNPVNQVARTTVVLDLTLLQIKVHAWFVKLDSTKMKTSSQAAKNVVLGNGLQQLELHPIPHVRVHVPPVHTQLHLVSHLMLNAPRAQPAGLMLVQAT